MWPFDCECPEAFVLDEVLDDYKRAHPDWATTTFAVPVDWDAAVGSWRQAVEDAAAASAASSTARALLATTFERSVAAADKAAILSLTDVCAFSRVPKRAAALGCAVLALYAPLGVVLVVARMLMCTVVGVLVTFLPKAAHTAVMRYVWLPLLGVWVVERGADHLRELERTGERFVVAASHSTEMDPIALRALRPFTFVAYDYFVSLWYLNLTPFPAFDILYTKQKQGIDGAKPKQAGPGAGKSDTRSRMAAHLAARPDSPIAIFPEGGLTTMKGGLLMFHRFMFTLGGTVLPCALRMGAGPLPLNVDHKFAGFLGNLLVFLFVPCRLAHVTWLPPLRPTDDDGDDGAHAAKQCQRAIAAATGIRATPLFYSDKRACNGKLVELEAAAREQLWFYAAAREQLRGSWPMSWP